MTEISAIKLVAPKVFDEVIDTAMQIEGVGLSDDFPLSEFLVQARVFWMADVSDEVCLRKISRLVFKNFLR